MCIKVVKGLSTLSTLSSIAGSLCHLKGEELKTFQQIPGTVFVLEM